MTTQLSSGGGVGGSSSSWSGFGVGFSRWTGARSSGGGGCGGILLKGQLKIGLIGGLLSKVLDDFHVLST
jgi:hypothetical protein